MGAEVHAGGTHFTASKRVPDATKSLIINLNANIEQAEQAKRLDPYTLAAKYYVRYIDFQSVSENGECSGYLVPDICTSPAEDLLLIQSRDRDMSISNFQSN